MCNRQKIASESLGNRQAGYINSFLRSSYLRLMLSMLPYPLDARIEIIAVIRSTKQNHRCFFRHASNNRELTKDLDIST